MALVLKDRVKETSTTTGTGSLSLDGAATGFQSFSNIGDTNTTYYAIVNLSAPEWEVGIGTYSSSGSTLSRDTILESSNSGSAVDFSAGTKDVFCTYPAEKAVVLDSSGNLVVSGTTTLSGNQIISVTDNSNAALRITQLGTGNALLVEDSANPDSSPFVVTGVGNVVRGFGTAQEVRISTTAITPSLQNLGTSGTAGSMVLGTASVTDTTAAFQYFVKWASGTVGDNSTSVAANELLGTLTWSGSDGTAQTQAASILAAVDGTPGTNDMPGRLVFSTTADGASSPTERMRIDSSGNVGVGTSSPAKLLDLSASNNGLTGSDANNTLRFTDSDISTATNQPLGKIEWYSVDATTSARVGAYILATAQGTSGGGNLEFGTATNTGTVTEQMQITGTGYLQFNSGYGSVATAYGCRAWVNFNGTGTVAIRASGNVSSITDNNTGDYTINFTTAMPDANYAAVGMAGSFVTATNHWDYVVGTDNFTASSLRVISHDNNSDTKTNAESVNVAIFR